MSIRKIDNVIIPLLNDMYDEEQRYQEIFTMLLMSGEYREQDIDAQVMEIMDHPYLYPEYN